MGNGASGDRTEEGGSGVGLELTWCYNHNTKEWNEIPSETCQTLIESMPRRIQAVLKAKGGHTKY